MQARPVIHKVSLTATLVAILAQQALWPETYQSLIPPVSMLLIAVFGIPHGAADHLIYMHAIQQQQKSTTTTSSKYYVYLLVFITGYLSLLMTHLLVWYIWPTVAFTLFLIFSVFHFGHAEFEYLSKPVPVPVYWSRGMLVLSMFAFAQPTVSFPIVSAVLNVHHHIDPSIAAFFTYLIPVLLCAHWSTLLYYRMPSRFIKDQAVRLGVLLGLFLFVHTYLAFAIYFSFFHAFEFMYYSPHMPTQEVHTLVYKAIIPFSLPVLGLIALHWNWLYLFTAFLEQFNILTTWHAFILVVSVLTTPHVIYLHYLQHLNV